MKKILIFIFSLVLACSFMLPVSAAYYDNSFPQEETGLTGGAFIECTSSIGDIVIILPWQYKENYLTFSTSGNLVNCSSGSIACAVYKNGVKYTGRITSWGTLSYQVSSTQYTYTDITVYLIEDTNCVFLTDSEAYNDSYYFSNFEIFVISLLFAILFIDFLRWLQCRT